MATKRPIAPQQRQPASLSLEEMRAAIPKLQRRLDDMAAFNVQQITAYGDHNASALAQKVDSTLQDILGHDSQDFQDLRSGGFYRPVISFDGNRPSPERIRTDFKDGLQRTMVRVRTLKEMYEERIADAGIADAPTLIAAAGTMATIQTRADAVFLVHGHDDAALQAVARLVSTLGLTPIILHEQASRNQTIIEKFEAQANEARFAVVLLTPDDIGGVKGSSVDQLRGRARQNVIYELGYFHAKLGRHQVCALHKHGVEIPSDYSGVVYVEIDQHDGWKLKLANEMIAAGLEVDTSRLFNRP